MNSAGAVVGAGQIVSTQNGKVEMLLTPGVFFRIDGNSSAQMVTPDLANTAVRLERGRAMLEVAEIHPENNLRVIENAAGGNGVSVQVLKPGLYDFDMDRGQIRVFDGEAMVQAGGRQVKIKSGHELSLNNAGSLRAQKFDCKAYEDAFYRWSSLRSSYMAEANADAARSYAGGSGVMALGWYGTGWYWDPWFDAYAFIPGDGIFYSPFGWGFYSPWLAFGAPYFGGYGYYHHFGPGYHSRYAGAGVGSVAHAHSVPGNGFAGRSTFGGSGFRGGSTGAFRGGAGGFHGGAGGFHGGGGGFRGGGGGFHGGGGRR